MQTCLGHLKTDSKLFSITRVFCSELLDVTLSFLQVVSQSLVLTQNSDYNNNITVTTHTNENTTDLSVCGVNLTGCISPPTPAETSSFGPG